MKFEPEVFISYAHLDDEAARRGHRWVSDFHRALEVRVAQLWGKRPVFYRDPKLNGNDDFSESLIGLVHRAGVLVPVVTPRYINSEWTRRELVEFCKGACENVGVQVGDKARLFKVVKTPVPLEKHPPELRPFLGYEFFRIDPETGKPHELDDPDEAYWTRLDDVAYDIKQLLEVLESDAPPESVAPPGRTVFLAETTFDLRAEHDAIKRDLQQNGYRVLPTRSMPVVASELEEFIRDQIRQSDVAVHLIGANYSVVPEGERRSLIEIQDEIAAERADSGGLTRLLWIPPGLRPADERQARVVDELRLNPRFEQGTDLLETPLEELKTVLYRRLKPSEKTASAPAVGTATENAPSIYFIYDKQDCAGAKIWKDYLFAQGFEVVNPVFEGDEAEIRELHEENLRISDAVLIHYGAGSELWLQRKLRELDKSPALGRTRPFRAIGVLIAPPMTPEKLSFKTHRAMTIAQCEGFAPDPIRAYLSKVQCA